MQISIEYKKCPKCENRTLRESKNNIWNCSNCNLSMEIPYLDDLIRTYSERYGLQVFNKITYFTNWIMENRNICNPIHAKYTDIKQFFKEDLDPRGHKRVSMDKWRGVLKKYYSLIEEEYKAMEIKFINPVPSLLGFKFSDNDDEEEDFEQKYLTYPTIHKVLTYYYLERNANIDIYNTRITKMFIIVSLIAYTGARISEIMSIKVNDVDLINRKIISGKTTNHKKTGKVLMFIPKFYVKYLTEYMENYELNEYLFPSEALKSIQTKSRFLTTKKVRASLKRLYDESNIEEPINPHAFRDYFNTAFGEMGLKEKFCDMLQGRRHKSVGVAHYNKRFKNWRPLRDKYDKYNPFPPFYLDF